MRILTLAIGVLIVAATFFAGTSTAARLPGGTYSETCWDVTLDNNVLTATCSARDGQPYDSSLTHPDFCRTGVMNQNGQLRCAGQHPAGSYARSCDTVQSNETTMSARCKRADGQWAVRVSLADPWTCNGFIVNKNGKLVCGIS